MHKQPIWTYIYQQNILNMASILNVTSVYIVCKMV